jgi:hypothetical protein
MSFVLISWLHLNHNAGAVISEVNAVLLTQTDSDDVAVPTHTPVVVSPFKLLHSFLGTSEESVISTVPSEIIPL